MTLTPTAGDDETLSRKHEAMLQRLSNRHSSRQSTASSNSPLTPTSESTQSFLSKFAQSKLSIESHLARIRDQPNPTHKPELDNISVSISDLEKLVAESSYFLPPYELRNCLSVIDNLKQSLDETTSIVVPKKKFSFKNKNHKKKVADFESGENIKLVGEKLGIRSLGVSGQDEEISCEPEKTDEEGVNCGSGKNSNLGSGKLGFQNLGVRAAPGLRGNRGEVLVEEVTDGEFTLSDLRDCEVRLKGRFRAMFVDKLVNCRVYVLGAVMGSVLIEGVDGCVFVLAAHQIRIHDAKSCDFYLRVRSRPIVEDSSGVRFAPYCLRYEGVEKVLEEANLDEETGNWANVDDFRWLRAVQSPNWSVLPENERIGVLDFSNV